MDDTEMCDNCQEFRERFYLDRGREYRDLVRQLIGLVDRGVFKVVSATAPLSELAGSEVRPADDLFLIFVCPRCGRTFRLSSTYHSNQAMWEMLIPDPPPTVQ